MSAAYDSASIDCWKCGQKDFATVIDGNRLLRTCRHCGAAWTDLISPVGTGCAEGNIGSGPLGTRVMHGKRPPRPEGDMER